MADVASLKWRGLVQPKLLREISDLRHIRKPAVHNAG
jgi:hypothetical protein